MGMARLFLDQAQRNDKSLLWSSTDITNDCPLAKPVYEETINYNFLFLVDYNLKLFPTETSYLPRLANPTPSSSTAYNKPVFSLSGV